MPNPTLSAHHELFTESQTLFPGGVNSPVRAFKSVGAQPIFFESASGATMTAVGGKTYVDFVGSWGPMILGHSHPKVVAAVKAQADKAFSFGAPSPLESVLAKKIQAFFPSMQKMRFTSSGTEAVMGALRAARGFTGRDLVIKFEGCYHGGADYLLVQAGSGLATFGTPDSKGVPTAIANTTMVLPFNDIEQLEKTFELHASHIAAVILEPVVGNMGCVPPSMEFLSALRALCTEHKCVLVFDEVMTGFRVAKGGAQERYGITPDLTTLGKIIGGGMPVGAYGGRTDIMNMISPMGPVYQAGTLSGNPISMSAGIATLSELEAPDFYDRLENNAQTFEQMLITASHGLPVCIQRTGSMLTVFFKTGPIRSWDDAKSADTTRFATFHASLIQDGVYLPPSQFEAMFVSIMHTPELIMTLAGAFEEAFIKAFA